MTGVQTCALPIFVIDAEDNKDQTLAYGIKKAPTLLVPNGNGYDVYDNASKIKGYIESLR